MRKDDDQTAERSAEEESRVITRTIRSTDDPDGSLTTEYVLQLRRQIRENAYRSAEVAEAIARRLIRSGDLWN